MSTLLLPSGGPVLRADHVTRAYGGRVVIDDLSFAVDPGHRLALVGENGIGKSTLLRLLAGVEQPDSGQVHRPSDVAYLAQEPPFGPDATVIDIVEEALTEVRAVAAELEVAAAGLTQAPGDDDGLADPAIRYDRALAHATSVEVWEADARAQRVLAGLGLGRIDQLRTSGSLSGGQRSRLALAAVLIRRPQVVLLDEPTNDLDDEAAEFLAVALSELPGGVVLASHDRVFLDETATGVLDLDPGLARPRVIGGSYRDFQVAKRVAREQWVQRWQAERAELADLRQAISPTGTARQVAHGREMKDRNKMGYGRRGDFVQQQIGRRVRSVQRRLTDLEREQVPRPPSELRFASTLTGTRAPDGVLISVRNAVVPGRLEVPSLDVYTDSALLVTGPNGSGKSTLLHLLAGDFNPQQGTAWQAKGITVALLEQEVGLGAGTRTARQIYHQVAALVADAVPLLELGLVAPRDVDRPLRELSVGQRRRVVLALLVTQNPDVLLLDEPTNHISVALADELGEALRTTPGAVVVASHDRWLRRGWHGQEVSVVAGRVSSPQTEASTTRPVAAPPTPSSR